MNNAENLHRKALILHPETKIRNKTIKNNERK